MTTPLFSIITVTLNNLTGLKKTLNSIKPQTFQDYEWLIIDGASTDGTCKFLSTHNIPYISEKDNGIYDAMNKGVKHANGQYIIFLNAGDMLEGEHTLQEVAERTKEEAYDFLYGDSIENIQGKILFKRSKSHHNITQNMFTHHQAMIYNRDIIQELKYDETYDIAADYDFTWQTIERSQKFLYLPFPICMFEAGGISQQQVLKGRIEQFKIRKTHHVSMLKNITIFIAQTGAYLLRYFCPKIYWRLKR